MMICDYPSNMVSGWRIDSTDKRLLKIWFDFFVWKDYESNSFGEMPINSSWITREKHVFVNHGDSS